jgi:hypothetical protein
MNQIFMQGKHFDYSLNGLLKDFPELFLIVPFSFFSCSSMSAGCLCINSFCFDITFPRYSSKSDFANANMDL